MANSTRPPERVEDAKAGEGDSAALRVLPDVDPTSSSFETDARSEGSLTRCERDQPTLKDEMAAIPHVVFGEDVADAAAATASVVPGKGGVFKATLASSASTARIVCSIRPTPRDATGSGRAQRRARRRRAPRC